MCDFLRTTDSYELLKIPPDATRKKCDSPSVRGGQVLESGGGGDLEARAELLKAPRGELRAPCGELEQPRHFLLRKVAHRCPEPVQDPEEFRRTAVRYVVRPQVRDAVFPGSTEQQLQTKVV